MRQQRHGQSARRRGESGGSVDAPVAPPDAPVGAPDAGAPFTLALDPARAFVQLPAGGSVDLALVVTPAAAGDLAVTVSGLPAGVTASALVIPAGMTGGTLTLSSAANAAAGALAATITATGGGQHQSVTLAVSTGVTSGRLDTGYGDGGVMRLALTASPTQVVPMADGGVLVVAASAGSTYPGLVVRLTSAGARDALFGQNGVAFLPVGATPAAVLIDSGGKILIGGGRVDESFAGEGRIWRLLADGSLDPGFGDGGTVAVTGVQFVTGLVLNGDGSLAALGWSADPAGTALTHVLAGGALDPSFGDGGTVTQTLNGSVNGISIPCTDGSWLFTMVESNAAALVRIDPAGHLDTSFGQSGYLAYQQLVRDAAGDYIAIYVGAGTPPHPITIGGCTATAGMSGGLVPPLADDGTLIVWGQGANGQNSAVLKAFKADGSANPGFGVGGTFDPARDLGLSPNPLWGVFARDSAGRVVYVFQPTDSEWMVVRLLL